MEMAEVNGENIIQAGEGQGDNSDNIVTTNADGSDITKEVSNKFVNGISAEEYEARLSEYQANGDRLMAENEQLRNQIKEVQGQYRAAFFGANPGIGTQDYSSNNPAVYDNEKVSFGDLIKYNR